MTAPVDYDRVVRLSPLVRRITQRNPGPYTGPGTNTHLVGTSSLFILDPGEEGDEAHVDRIVAAVGSARVEAVIPSHGHEDHWTLAPRLAQALGAPIWFFGNHSGFRTDRSLADGELIAAGDLRLEVLHTPGHIPDHLCFRLVEEGAVFPGDMVMGWSTSIIAPPEGDLVDYLASLERLAAIPDLAILYPAHGDAITAPVARIRELIDHRNARTRQALAALADGPRRLDALVARIYRDVDPRLHEAAAASLLAHLLALEAAGAVERAPGAALGSPNAVTWRLANDRPGIESSS